MRKLASKEKLIEEVMIIFKAVSHNIQVVFGYFLFSVNLPEHHFSALLILFDLSAALSRVDYSLLLCLF